MSLELMDRVSLALLNGSPSGDERNAIMDAFTPDVREWEDLSADVRQVVLDLEVRAPAAIAARAGSDEDLVQYWTAGKGLARWAESLTPWTTLRDLLAKHVTDPEGLASVYFHKVFGRWPGDRSHESDRTEPEPPKVTPKRHRNRKPKAE